MISTYAWGFSLFVGTAATFFGAFLDDPKLQMTLAAAACLSFALLGLVQRRRLIAAGAGAAGLAGGTATAMGVVWLWAAASLLLTYTLAATWGEWWQYVLGAGAVGLLCLFLAATLSRDAAAGREDATMLSLARYLNIGQLAGMLIAMVGLIADAKMPRDPKKPDWAACAIFFFGAAALATLSADALRPGVSSRKT